MNNRKYLFNTKIWFIILVHCFLYFAFLSRTNKINAKAGKGNYSSFFPITTPISSKTSRYLIWILHLLPHRCRSLSAKLSDLSSMKLILILVSVFRIMLITFYHLYLTLSLHVNCWTCHDIDLPSNSNLEKGKSKRYPYMFLSEYSINFPSVSPVTDV